LSGWGGRGLEGWRGWGFDGGFVHTAGVEVAKLLLIRARRVRLMDEPFENRTQCLTIPVGQLGERSPSRVLRRDRVLLQPASVGIGVEVCTSGGRRIHVGGIERFARL